MWCWIDGQVLLGGVGKSSLVLRFVKAQLVEFQANSLALPFPSFTCPRLCCQLAITCLFVCADFVLLVRLAGRRNPPSEPPSSHRPWRSTTRRSSLKSGTRPVRRGTTAWRPCTTAAPPPPSSSTTSPTWSVSMSRVSNGLLELSILIR